MSDFGLLQLFLRMRVFSHFAAVHRHVLRYATDHDELSAGFRLEGIHKVRGLMHFMNSLVHYLNWTIDSNA